MTDAKTTEELENWIYRVRVFLGVIADPECDPMDDAADAVSVLSVWRASARALLDWPAVHRPAPTDEVREAPAPADAALREALDERDLFINPHLLDLYADEIDCAGVCEFVRDTECVMERRGQYCPNNLAETLRAVAKVARAALASGKETG